MTNGGRGKDAWRGREGAGCVRGLRVWTITMARRRVDRE